MRKASIRRVVQSIGMLTVKELQELVVELQKLSSIKEDGSEPSKKEQ